METTFPIKDIVKETIQKHSLIEAGTKVLAAVSGGADSVCLLYILKSISEGLHFTLEAVHVNHQLRGKESDEDEQYVRNLCDKLGIKVHVFKLNIREIAREKRMSIEEAAREERYRVFRQLAEEIGADVISVAHNRNDQAETILLNIIRGTGLEGLKGMSYRNGPVIRPLLDIPRKEIELFCRNENLYPRVDSSNLDVTYTRNKVRLRILPYIGSVMGTDAVNAIVRMSELLDCDNEYLEICAKTEFNRAVLEKNAAVVKIDLDYAVKLHQAVLSRVIRHCILELTGMLKGIGQKHIFDVLELIRRGKTGNEIHLPRGIVVKRSYTTMDFALRDKDYAKEKKVEEAGPTEDSPESIKQKPTSESELGTQHEFELNIPGETQLCAFGISIKAGIASKNSEEGTAGKCCESYYKEKKHEKNKYKEDKNSLVQYFDYDLLNTGIKIRTRRNGDRISPRGFKGTKKLKKYFIDRKIPREERDNILLIAKDDVIVWAVELETNEKFKVTDRTRNILKLEVGKINK
jgi:tRNA(Ile)-lysidine synthase